MFIAIVDFAVAEENRPEALATLLHEIPAIRAMKGNIAIQAYVDPVNMQALRIFHEWQDAESFEKYTMSDAFKSSGQKLRPMMVGAPSSRRLTATLMETVA